MDKIELIHTIMMLGADTYEKTHKAHRTIAVVFDVMPFLFSY